MFKTTEMLLYLWIEMYLINGHIFTHIEMSMNRHDSHATSHQWRWLKTKSIQAVNICETLRFNNPCSTIDTICTIHTCLLKCPFSKNDVLTFRLSLSQTLEFFHILIMHFFVIMPTNVRLEKGFLYRVKSLFILKTMSISWKVHIKVLNDDTSIHVLIRCESIIIRAIDDMKVWVSMLIVNWCRYYLDQTKHRVLQHTVKSLPL